MKNHCKASLSFSLILFIFALLSIPVMASDSLENKHLKILMNENGSLTFCDKVNNVQWGSSFPGWVKLSSQSATEKISLSKAQFSSRQLGDTIFFSFDGIRGKRIEEHDFKLEGKLVLTGRHMDISLSQMISKFLLEDLEYPAHILSVKSGTEEGYIVAPHLQGVLYPSRYDAGFMRYGQNVWDMIADKEEWWNFESGNLNMPWFGASKSGSCKRLPTPSSI